MVLVTSKKSQWKTLHTNSKLRIFETFARQDRETLSLRKRPESLCVSDNILHEDSHSSRAARVFWVEKWLLTDLVFCSLSLALSCSHRKPFPFYPCGLSCFHNALSISRAGEHFLPVSRDDRPSLLRREVAKSYGSWRDVKFVEWKVYIFLLAEFNFLEKGKKKLTCKDQNGILKL